MDINTVTLVGRLTKDPELKKTQTGKSVCSFTLAVGRRTKEDVTDFINCVVWDQSAEFLAQFGRKGRTCGVVGKIQTRSYEDRDGAKRQAVEVVANYIQLLNDTAREEQFDTGQKIEITSEDLPF